MILAKRMLLSAMIVAAASGAHAMEVLSDDTLSTTTGQQGIDIFTNLNLTGTTGVMTYTDGDGFTGYTGSGDLNIRQLTASGTLKTSIDVGYDATSSKPSLQIAMSAPSLTFGFNGIDICQSAATPPCTVASSTSVITTPGAVSVGITNFAMTLQLGNNTATAGQQHLGKLSSSAPIAVTIGNGAANQVIIKDPNNGNGGIGIGKLALTGLDLGDGSTVAKSTFLDVCANAAATATCTTANAPGLQLAFGTSTLNNVGVTLTNLTLGDTGATPSPVLGTVALTGLNLGGTTVRIVGH